MTQVIKEPGNRLQGDAKYTIDDGEMAAGSTFGSPRATLIVKATGAIERMYAPELGSDVFGTMVAHHWDAVSGVPLLGRRGTFEIYPANQRHVFQLSNAVNVSENIFLLSSAPGGADHHVVDPPAAYYTLDLHNANAGEVRIATYLSVRLRGNFTGTTNVRYDKAHRAFVVSNSATGGLTRVASCSPAPVSWEATFDSAKPSAAEFPGMLTGNDLHNADEAIGIFHFEHRLRPGESASCSLLLTFSADDEDSALAAVRSLPDAAEAMQKTDGHYDDVLQQAIVITPDAEVNRGVLWAKANIARTQNLTPQGWCFVNDPARSNNSVARDTSWYAFGADYVTPYFTREALLWYLDHLEPSGMVVEYFDIRTGKPEDYGLNINDNSPLLIMALWHHYCVTGDREFLEYVYARVHKIAAYILSQRNDMGLVWCTADGTADWGIVGWRNVIDGYRLSGATTEVNSECFAALGTLREMANEMGDKEKAAEYGEHAQALRTAINEHLLDKKRNLYYLNIDLDGTPRTDVTCDLVFPVMFGVADHEVSSNIISHMSTPQFWSEAGMHTVPRNDIHYGPTHGYGLLGGIWSGPTFWYAFAASRFNPEFMAYALSTSFKHYSEDPRRNNTVPGQFSEWLHGETLTNQGMMLSPWFAPKFLWAALEGAAGLDVASAVPRLRPRPAGSWSWVAARKVMVRGRRCAWFAVRTGGLNVFSDYAFDGVARENVYEEDMTEWVRISGDTAAWVALRRKGRVSILIGNTFDRTMNVGVTVEESLGRKTEVLRRYDTLRNEWLEVRDFDMRSLAQGFPVQISAHGFCLLELSAESEPNR